MGSGIDSPSGLDSTSSLELALDQAIAARYIGVNVDERAPKKRRFTPTQNFAVVAAKSDEQEHTPTEDLRGRASTALTVAPPSGSGLMRPPARLRWKGIEVSDEFQEYAARVARGEDVEPYRGAVLSRPCAEFPWSAPREQQMLPPERHSLTPQRPSFAPVSMSLAPPPPLSEPSVYPERGRALKTALWLAGAVSSIVGALGVGAGATNTTGNEFDERSPDPFKATPNPTAAAARDEALASSLDQAPVFEASIGERQLGSLAAANAAAVAGTTINTKPAAPTRPLTPSPFSATIAPRSARVAASTAVLSPSPTIPVTADGAPASAPSSSRLTIPPRPVLAAGEIARGVVTTARPGGAASNAEGSLFSDRPSF